MLLRMILINQQMNNQKLQWNQFLNVMFNLVMAEKNTQTINYNHDVQLHILSRLKNDKKAVHNCNRLINQWSLKQFIVRSTDSSVT